MTRTAEQELSAEYQRAVGEFVSREVIYCVSTLICDLAQNPEWEHYEDIIAVCVSDDWETAAFDEGWREDKDSEGNDCYYRAETDDTVYNDGWQELCEEQGVGPYQSEAYEHWIVSNYLARQLGARGEMISHNIHGLTI